MSKIDKLSILGIRSFDNKRSETIQFYTPLTLIVGYNGSGKTTIIECLKYAATGELPPNSKGGAFIHDPKFCGEKEVFAQVKISFKSTSGAWMVVSRNLQLTVKPHTRQQKTLEGSLLMVKEGERTTISSRVAELDQVLPQYLGVSKAILESVIFCHQDESLWPMSEPSALKKRFDEIFEAMKYTKAVDNIKALRKKQNEDLSKFRIMEQHAKEDKAKADKAEKKSQELADEIEDLRAATQALHLRAQEAGDKAQEAWNSAAAYTEVLESLKVARSNQEWYQAQLRDLRRDLRERNEPDEWLESELSRFEERTGLNRKRKADQEALHEDIQARIYRTRSLQSDKQIEAGKYEQQKATHEDAVKDREEEVKRFARDNGIHGYQVDLDHRQLEEFRKKVIETSRAQTSKLEKFRAEYNLKIREAEEKLGTLREQRSAMEEGRKSARHQLKSNEERFSILRGQLDSILTDEGARATIRSRVDELRKDHSAAQQELSAASFEPRIKEANRGFQQLEDESASLNQDLIREMKRAGDFARLDRLKKESEEKLEAVSTLSDTYSNQLRALFGQNWDRENLEQSLFEVIDSKKRGFEKVKRDRDASKRTLEEIESRIRTCLGDMKKKESESKDMANLIHEVTKESPDRYLEILAGAQSDRDTRLSDVEAFKSLRKYFGTCIMVAQSDTPACRLCSRSFKDRESAQHFITKLEHFISQNEKDEVQKELYELEKDLTAIKNAGTSYDTWLRLSNKEVPELRDELIRLRGKRETITGEIEAQDNEVTRCEEAFRDAEMLSKPVGTITRCWGEYVKLRDEIESLRGPDQEQLQSARLLEDLQDQQSAIATRSRETRNEILKLQQEERAKRERLNALGLELSRATNNLTAADHELEKKETTRESITRIKQSNQDTLDEIKRLDAEVQKVSSEIQGRQFRLEQARAAGESQQKELQLESSGFSDFLARIDRADRAIRSYLDDGGLERLRRCLDEIESFRQEISSLEVQSRNIIVEVDKVREELDNQDRMKRIIEDNLRYRKINKESQSLDAKIRDLISQNAEADQSRHREEAEKWQREHNLLKSQETSKMGAMKAKDDQLLQLLTDWNSDYKDAAVKFKKAHIEVETTRAAVEDLGRYGGALNSAIMKYHSLKMEEINRLIEELWRKTYKGTDVDTILIRSDHEPGKGNRSNNYRVCMVKQDVEMDMRGRCSAGQKVLASIIIRLALAECFGVNCGLVALDEPTTNLDRDNIRSLAESLHDLIQQRQGQSNFQLIVITHDEEFLRYMKCADFCDNYYRISRNDRQKSMIERQSIADVV